MMRVESTTMRPSSISAGVPVWPVRRRITKKWMPGGTDRRMWGMPFQSRAQRTFSLKCENANCHRTGSAKVSPPCPEVRGSLTLLSVLVADRIVKNRNTGRPARRRSAEESREAILAAAERLLRTGGPETVRLKRIAAEAGISHPLILHHFRSREGMIEALVDRALKTFGSELVRGLAAPAGTNFLDGIETIWRIVGEERYAHVFAWLALSGRTPALRGDMAHLAQALHGARERSDLAQGRRTGSLDETRFAMVLMSVALVGDALVGRVVRRRLGLRGDAATDRRFRLWLANLLEYGRTGVRERWTG